MDLTSQELRENTPWGELLLRVRAGPPPTATLMLEGVSLMDTESGHSERALAERGLAVLREVRGVEPTVGVAFRSPDDRTGEADHENPRLRVLLGGLGLGITLEALLADPAVEFVQVVERFACLIAWNRAHQHRWHRPVTSDPRVRCRAADLIEFLERGPRHGPPAGSVRDGPFDLLLLDIDNGPTRLSLPGNARVYTPDGMEWFRRWTARRAVVVFWASEPSSEFEKCLGSVRWAEWRREEVAWRTVRGDREMTDTLYYLIGR